MGKEEPNVRELLMKTGKAEFLEKGFEKASLRKICRNAGVTTGAVYFFFENKEDLFHQIVADTVVKLQCMGMELSKQELEEESSSADGDQIFMKCLWQNREEVLLLLEKSEGTRYENFKNEIFSQFINVFSLFFEKYGNMGTDRNLIRIIVEMRIHGYLELLKGDYSMEETLRLAELVGCYADGGFYSLVKGQQEQNKKRM